MTCCCVADDVRKEVGDAVQVVNPVLQRGSAAFHCIASCIAGRNQGETSYRQSHGTPTLETTHHDHHPPSIIHRSVLIVAVPSLDLVSFVSLRRHSVTTPIQSLRTRESRVKSPSQLPYALLLACYCYRQ